MLFLDRETPGESPGATVLFVEGAVSAVVGCAGGLILLPDQTGLVSIFLCAMGSLRTVDQELAWNRIQVVELKRPSTPANVALTLRLLALFAGQLLAFSLVGMFADMELLRSAFAYQVDPVLGVAYATMTFPPAWEVFGHNAGVLALFFTLALLFRHGGALLAVAWNASVWGVVFGALARGWSADGGPSLLEAYLRVMGGVFPHMAAEAVGYVLVGFAGVFLAQGLSRRGQDAHYWETLLRTVARMMLLALLAVAAGAAWEGWVAPSLVAWLAAA